MPLSPGQVLNNRYRIAKLLGQGGFGAVYRAWDTNLNGPCALKENFDTSQAAQSQFQREASMLFNLRHPNLPRVFDAFSVPGQGQYLVMDYIEGEDLGTMLQQVGGPLPESQVLSWMIQVCDALIYLHSRNPSIIHRDIKPANIRVTPRGDAILVDFGIAKIYDPNLATTKGARAITPGFSPIEQYSGGGRTDARSDIYAVGATMYILLTGNILPEAPERNLGVPVTPIRALNPAVSAHTETTVQRALEMYPDRRFASAKELKNVLASIQRPEKAPEASGYQNVQPVAQKQVSGVWVGVSGVFLALIAVIVVLLTGGGGSLKLTETASTVIAVPTSTLVQKSTASPRPIPSPTSISISSPTTIVETAIPTLTSTNAPSPTPSVVFLIDWEMNGLFSKTSGCYQDTANCWECVNSTHCQMISMQAIVIDHQWKNPALLFYQTYKPSHYYRTFTKVDYGVDLSFEIDGFWRLINEFRKGGSWNLVVIELDNYRGQKLRFKLGYKYNTGVGTIPSWIIQDIRIDPNYQPMP